jgi:orotate phosphoribosyltransferase
VLGIVTIFDYEFSATQRKLAKLGVDLTALTNLDTVLHHAQYTGVISEEESAIIKDWQQHPSKWNK